MSKAAPRPSPGPGNPNCSSHLPALLPLRPLNHPRYHLVLAYTEHDIFEDHGLLEGKTEGTFRLYADMKGGPLWSRGKAIFTGRVNGKSGTLDGYVVSKLAGTMWKGNGTCITAFISGTGELANLRGTSYMEFSWAPWDLTRFPPSSKMTGTMSSTLWFIE